MARKLRGFERVLDAPALFAVAYSEIGSSIYFALGIIAAQALGLTPVVLLLSGGLFLLVSLSYAEGTAAIQERGGAATFVRRAFNDPLGFATGWALLLDYLIVMALSALFLPHYLGTALDAPGLTESPWDVVIAILVLSGIAAVRLVRHSRLHTGALAIALLDIVVQAMLVAFGVALLFSADTLVDGLDFAAGQGWHELAFALPLAMLAYTGLETVANLATEAREPGRTLPRSLFSAIGLVVLVTVAIATIGVTAYPAEDGTTDLAEDWLEAPIAGIVAALDAQLPDGLGDALRVVVGVSGALILLAAATTSASGCARLLHAMGEHAQLPHVFGRLERRTLVSRPAIAATALTSIAIVVAVALLADDDVEFLASLYSFGVLLAFTAAQLAVIRLRFREPQLERPFRARPEVRIRGVALPLPALVGAPLTAIALGLALATHQGARYAGPAWLVVGLALYLITRLTTSRAALLGAVEARELPPGARFGRVLVPMKLGDIGEEMVATAIALAKERGASVEALYVLAVPRSLPLDAPLPADVEARARASLEEARALGEDNDVVVSTAEVRARSIGHAIVDEAGRRDVDLIVLGSSPRWRRQSRFFSPTVDHVLRHAPCEVLVVAFPEGIFDDGRTP
ncbi:MAG TPA: universal stress protein [Gaiellaceae bacterium]|nr:universal stress protein [Gaiellaceae bacterium]